MDFKKAIDGNKVLVVKVDPVLSNTPEEFLNRIVFLEQGGFKNGNQNNYHALPAWVQNLF